MWNWRIAQCETAESQSDVTDNDFHMLFEDNADNKPEYHNTTEEIQERLASLLLQMQAVLYVSKLATQEIVSEFHDIDVLIGELNEYAVKKVLRQHSCNIDENTITLVTDGLHSLSPLDSISHSGCLGSEQKGCPISKKNVVSRTKLGRF